MFGMSVFQSVLERLKAEEDAEAKAEANDPSPHSIRGLGPGFVSGSGQKTSAAPEAVHRAYFDTAGDDMLAAPLPLTPPVMPDHLARIGPADIAADLDLSEMETAPSLAAKRRTFAAINHPDLHHADFRQNATIRMKIANMMIDEALRRLHSMPKR